METDLGDDLGFQVKQPRGGTFPDGHGSICEGLLGPRLSVLRSLLAAPACGVRQLCARYGSLQRKCILLLPHEHNASTWLCRLFFRPGIAVPVEDV